MPQVGLGLVDANLVEFAMAIDGEIAATVRFEVTGADKLRNKTELLDWLEARISFSHAELVNIGCRLLMERCFK